MALHLARRKQRLPSNPSLLHFFSKYSSDSSPKNAEQPSPSPSSDIKTRLKLKQEQGSTAFTSSDLAKNLSKFERRSTFQSRPPISLEALYKQNAGTNTEDRRAQEFNSSKAWENLKSLSIQSNKSYKKTLPKDNVGGSVEEGKALPMKLFRKEMERRKEKEGETEEKKTEFLTVYSEEELGEKLRKLRPEGGSKEFSLVELNERLVKLRQGEEKEVQSRSGKFVYLRNVVENIKKDNMKKDTDSQQNFSFRGYLGDVPEYKLHPPKDALVETVTSLLLDLVASSLSVD